MSQTSTGDPLLGTVIDGKYRVETLLGRGGMGKVYRVTHMTLNKDFALKVVTFHSGKSEANHLIRFHREAEALAKINHPNVVMVTDFGVLPDESPYIVMEFIEGITLRQLLEKQGTLGERETIHITKQICAALHEAHRQNIIHRDLKPENIMIQEFDDGEIMARVLDFGIAKLIQSDGSENLTSATGSELPGTIKYMSPEQFYGDTLDVRADIFTICLMIYEMLTSSVPAVMLGKVRPLDELRPGLTPRLSEIILKGLAQSPEDRHKSALELKRELESLEQSAGTQQPSSGPLFDLTPLPQPRENYNTSNNHSITFDNINATELHQAPPAEDYASEEKVREAITDFELFLAGKRAPAVIEVSLALVIRFEIPQIVNIIIDWAMRVQDQSLFDALTNARNKIFDIFFYRIT
ncbi:MAG: serine/threonine-protein kinase, partial [Acidobacteriota bacterium]